MDILFFTRGVLAGRSKESLYYWLHIDKENDSVLNLLSNMLWTHFNALSMGLIMAPYTPLASRPMTINILSKAGSILIGNHKYKDDLFHYQEERKDKVHKPRFRPFLTCFLIIYYVPYSISFADWIDRHGSRWRLIENYILHNRFPFGNTFSEV